MHKRETFKSTKIVPVIKSIMIKKRGWKIVKKYVEEERKKKIKDKR